MTTLRQHAEAIVEQFSGHMDIETDGVESELQQLVEEYRIPESEARRTVTNRYLEATGMDRNDLPRGGSSSEVELAEISEPDRWVDVRVTVVDLWDPRSESVAQVGLVGDPSGTLKFTTWAKSDLPALKEGQSYRLRNVVTDEYQGRYSIKLNRTTEIEELDEEIEVGDDTVEIEGALVDVQSGSGLIKRCPEEGCTRVLQNGRCSEHGEVDGEFDLRIKGVLDDGTSVQEVIFDREATESLADITLDEAKTMAMDALDTGVVADEIRATILGRYYRITGPRFGRYVLANAVEQLGAPADAEAVLIKARSMG